MKILIAKKNAPIIERYFVPRTYELQTRNTVTFQIGKEAFYLLHRAVWNAGFNPYALLTW